MKTRQKSTSRPLFLRLESLENRELLSAAPWSAPVDALDAQLVETASAQIDQDASIDLSNAVAETSAKDVSFHNVGATNHQYKMSWNELDSAYSYLVKIDRDGKFILYKKGLQTPECTVSGLYAGKTYTLRAYAVSEAGRQLQNFVETTFAPVRIVGSANKFVAGDTLNTRMLASADASFEIAWYYVTPNGDVEIEEARGLSSFTPESARYDVKAVATGTGLSEGSVSEAYFVHSGYHPAVTNYNPETKTLQIEAEAVEGAVKYYLWKPAPSGNMAIYQRCETPFFTVEKLAPGQTTNFRVTAYDSKLKLLDSKDFQFASLTLKAPELYEAEESLDVKIGANSSLNYDLSWYYVTETGDVEIAEAKGQTSFTPAEATYPIKIVATPVSDSEGLCVCDPVEAIVTPHIVKTIGINDPYYTTKQSFVTSWKVVPEATRYTVQKLNASGQWAKMTAFNFVDGQIVGDTRATISDDGTLFSYSVNMVKVGVEERYRVLALDAKGSIIKSGEFSYNPIGITVENDAYDLANGTQTLRAVPVQDMDANALQYQWYYSTNDDTTNWQIVDGATSAELVLSVNETALNYNYKVLATDPNEDRQSVAFARADTVATPTGLKHSIDPTTGELILIWNADANLTAEDFTVQYYRTDAAYDVWVDVPKGTIVANGNGSFTLTHVNGTYYSYVRVRANNATGWSKWDNVSSEGIIVDTMDDVVDPNDGVTSLREAIATYQTLSAKNALVPGLAVTFNQQVFKDPQSKISLKDDTPVINVTENVRIDASKLGYRLQIQATNSDHNVFRVAGDSASIELVSLNLVGASVAEEGGIVSAQDGATIKVVNCAFTNSSTSQHGGAIALLNGSTLTVEDSLFQGNSAQLGGGAIYAVDASTVTVSNSTFTNNAAGSEGNGGAIWVDASSTLNSEYSSFASNTSQGNGGAIAITGNSSATVLVPTFSRNTASKKGGSFWVDASNLDLEFDDSSVSASSSTALLPSETTNQVDSNAASSILDFEAVLLDDAFVELEEEIEIFF